METKASNVSTLRYNTLNSSAWDDYAFDASQSLSACQINENLEDTGFHHEHVSVDAIR